MGKDTKKLSFLKIGEWYFPQRKHGEGTSHFLKRMGKKKLGKKILNVTLHIPKQFIGLYKLPT